MASKKLKTAYVLFLFSFFVWLAALLSMSLQTGTMTNRISLPNSSLLMVFCGSAIVASVSCVIIGVDYLGLDFRPKQGPKDVKQTPGLPKTVPLPQSANAARAKEAKLQDSPEQEEAVSVMVPQPIEEEQETE